MPYRAGLRLFSGLIAIGLASLALSACGGGGSNDAATLLKQTFGGAHKVSSGRLNIVLTVNPSGSNTLKSPITLTFGGPFQSLGTGKLPQSNFNISLNSGGKGGAVGILSTGTAGYVTFQGQSYQLPQASFQKLESSFSQIASSPGSTGGGSNVLSKLGIQPLHWLQNPTVVGTENVGGADTTHIRATINVTALLSDFNTFLSRAASLGVSGASSFPHGISSASQTRIAGAVKNPHFDVWTGNSDKTIRKLQVGLTLPVTGQIATLLGGLSSADIGLSMEYADLNQPQSIAAPASVQPYSQFQAKLRTFEQSVQGALTSQVPGGSSGSGAPAGSAGSSGSNGSAGVPTTPSGSAGVPTAPSGSGSSSKYQAYSRCIQAAGSDISKMQQCAPLLNGGG
jgi:hypothetical protein